MWGKIIITMYRLWLSGLYGLYGTRCPLSSKRAINLISLSYWYNAMYAMKWILLNTVKHKAEYFSYNIDKHYHIFQNKFHMSMVYNRVATRQGKVREKFIFSRSGNCQGIWKNVREILKRGKCQGNVREFHVRILKSMLCYNFHS